MFSKINIIFRTIYLNLTWKNNDKIKLYPFMKLFHNKSVYID